MSPAIREEDRADLRLALPLGSLFEPCLDMLDRAGFDTAEPRGESRALIFDLGGLTIVTVRPSDVPIYVEDGAAELGVTGKDVLVEQSDRAVYELADLDFGHCRMVLAAHVDSDHLAAVEQRLGSLRIATKYPRTAAAYFAATGRQADLIEVKGSVELAPLVGLADGIVDLVDTGRTLADNGLEVVEEISACSARLLANRVAHKLRVDELDAMVERLRGAAG
ncbi:MAG: ATP phosphoribosyltransferase [Solirubrobacterales bacterium]